MGTGIMEEDMLLILYIKSFARVTGRRSVVVPGHCFNLLGVGMESEDVPCWK